MTTTTATDRVLNFSAGPGVLPEEVLRQVQADVWNIDGTGVGIMEHSHRAGTYDRVLAEAIEDCRKIGSIGDEYEVLFMTGGASSQNYLIPANLLPDGGTAPLNMRWRIKNSTNTVATATLEEGQVYLVPVAARKEAGKRVAIITNEIFLVEKTAKWAMPPGKSKWSLRIHNEDGEWESAHSYVLLVPKPDWGNGHFVLEVRYDGVD